MTTDDVDGESTFKIHSKNIFIFIFEGLKVIFAIFDVDRSGSVTKDELTQLLRTPSGPPVTDEFVDEFMKIADADSKYSNFSSDIAIKISV
jgi:Ca2+-binding EF-hand superfamily protein